MTTSHAATATSTEAEQFVERFTEIWKNPSPEALNSLLHPDVRLVQPIDGEMRGHKATLKMWRRFFAALPDAHAEVLSWAARDDVVFLELRMHGTAGGRPIEWDLTDRIRLEDGLVRERVSYFDSAALMGKLARNPRGVWAFLKARRA